MHNGALFDLNEVVEFYNKGGGTNEFAANKTKLLKPLNLSDKEMEDLIAFIESLSGPAIKMTAPKLPPYAALPVAQAK
jgi:cytochrome c peroxidase